MRYSPQRDVVYQVILASDDHPTAELILERAKKIMPSINIATVYRNLASLEKNKKIIRISIADGDRFDKTICHHVHFHCLVCGNVEDINSIDIATPIHSIEQSTTFTIEKTDIIFTGICEKCNNKKGDL